MLRFALELSDKSEWLRVFDPDTGSLFIVSKAPPPIGDSVRVDVVVGKSGPKVIFRGKVITHKLKSNANLPNGFTMTLGRHEAEKVNYLNGFVRGGMLNLRERRRIPIRLVATYGGISGPVQSFTRDINEEGVFVVTEDPLPEQSEIHLLILFPEHDEPISLSGTVFHTVVVEDEDIPGMGIKFNFTDDTEKKMSKLIDEIEARFLKGSLPEECLL